jgi:DNA-binding transcriptional LysR family regulator
MSVLLKAVESGSLSKASRALQLPLATVSRRVAELEAHLNATLLIRSAKGLELTRMTVVLEAFEPRPRPVHLVYDTHDRLPVKLRAFVDFAVPRMRERLTLAAL